MGFGELIFNTKFLWGLLTMNLIIEVAKTKRTEKYVTPEDVTYALSQRRFSSTDIRMNMLEILGNQTEYGAEDASLCAFLAWKGKRR